MRNASLQSAAAHGLGARPAGQLRLQRGALLPHEPSPTSTLAGSLRHRSITAVRRPEPLEAAARSPAGPARPLAALGGASGRGASPSVGSMGPRTHRSIAVARSQVPVAQQAWSCGLGAAASLAWTAQDSCSPALLHALLLTLRRGWTAPRLLLGTSRGSDRG